MATDFTTLSTSGNAWKSYAESRGGSSDVQDWIYYGVYAFEPTNGYIQIPLPTGYDTLQVEFGSGYTSGTIILYLDDVEVTTAYAQVVTYTGTDFTAGLLKVVEYGGSIGFLKISLASDAVPGMC